MDETFHLHTWLTSRWLSLYDACELIEGSDSLRIAAVAKYLAEYLDDYENLDDALLTTYARLLDSVDIAIG